MKIFRLVFMAALLSSPRPADCRDLLHDPARRLAGYPHVALRGRLVARQPLSGR